MIAHADAPAEEGRGLGGSASNSDNEENPGAENGGKSKGVIRASQQEIIGTGTNTAATSFKDKNRKNRTIQ